MKKTFIKLLCLTCSVIIFLTSCNIATPKEEHDFNIEQEEYLIRFSMVSGSTASLHYTFVVTPDDRLLAEYVTNSGIQQVQIKLNEHQSGLMEERINEVLTLTEEDIEFHDLGISDYWFCTINYNDVVASFNYGASKSTPVNILLEQIIGCVDSEKSLETKDTLQPIPSLFREHMSYYGNFEEEE